MSQLVERKSDQATSIGFYDGPSYALLRDIAKDFAASDIVPQRFQKNPANCMVAVNMAVRMKSDPLMVMQNLYIVHGTPGWSSQFMIACFNQAGRYGSILYRFTGEKGTDSWGCIAYAKNIQTGEEIQGAEVTIAIAKKEGWYAKNGSKWQTMPQQMLMYRAAAWMIRTHAPEIGMGFQTKEEVEDVYGLDRGKDGVYSISQAASALNEALAGEPKPEISDRSFCPDGTPSDIMKCAVCTETDGCENAPK